MKTRTFRLDKLVRDKIVQQTESHGGTVNHEQLKGRKLTNALIDKLIEEAQELKNSKMSASELADLKEILISIRQNLGLRSGELEEARRKKAAINGRFKNGDYIHELTLPSDNKWAKYYASDPKRFPEVSKK